MSKHRTPIPGQPASDPSQGVTSASSLVEILRAKAVVRQEIIRRLDYQELLKLQATLAKLPPVPEDSGPSANEA
jgi:hypothetical protein